MSSEPEICFAAPCGERWKPDDSVDEQSSPSLVMTTFFSFEELAGFQENWDRLVEDIGGPIYQTYDWCRVWCRHYAQGRELRFLVCKHNGDWVAVLPMIIDTLGTWPFGLRVAKCIGIEFSTSRFALIAQEEFRSSVLELACQQLLEKDSCDLISFGPMTGANEFVKDLALTPTANRRTVRRHAHDPAVLMTYDLRVGFDGLMSRISAATRTKLRRKMRRVEDQEGVIVSRITNSEELDAEFEAFCELHRQRWEGDGKQGHFNDWPGAKEFHREMIRAQSQHRRCHLYRIVQGERLISYTYGYTCGEWHFALLPARSTDKTWDKLSIGQVAALIQMRNEAADGIKYADSGQGFYDYKKMMGATVERLDRVLVTRRAVSSALRVALWRNIALLLHLIYYKLWFIRLRRLFIREPRPLWSYWSRTRL